jgi:hypothetical protein
VLTQELLKPSLQLEEEILAPTPGISPGEGSPTLAQGTSPDKDGTTLISEADPGDLAGPIGQAWEPWGEVAAIIGLPSPNTNWWRPISKYLRLRTIPDNKTKTRRLARQAKGYLIHSDEMYHCSTSGVLQWCIPTEESKALLLDVHEGVCGHHASSRSMVGKAFQQGVLCKVDPSSGLGAPYNPHYMVVCYVGPRPSGTLQESTQGLDPPARRSR